VARIRLQQMARFRLPLWWYLCVCSVTAGAVRVAVLFNFPIQDDTTDCRLRLALTSKFADSFRMQPVYLSDHPCKDAGATETIRAFYDVGKLLRLESYNPVQLLIEAQYQNDLEVSALGHALHVLENLDVVVAVVCDHPTAAYAVFAARLSLLQHLIAALPLHRQPTLWRSNICVGDGMASIERESMFMNESSVHGMMGDVALAISECLIPAPSSPVVALGACMEDQQRRRERIRGTIRQWSIQPNAVIPATCTSTNTDAAEPLRSTLEFPSIFSNRYLLRAAVGQSEFESDKGMNVPAPSCTLDEDDVAVLAQMRRHLSSTPPRTRRERILCMTYTTTINHNRIRSISRTWAKRCDGYLAFSNETDARLSIFHLTQPIRSRNEAPFVRRESYNEMWYKTQLIWTLVYANKELFDYFDYFLLGGDDLYVAVDNLRDYLNSDDVLDFVRDGEKYLNSGSIRTSDSAVLNTSVPLYLGRLMHVNDYGRFNSGGSCYVLNRAAVSVLIHAISLDSLPAASDDSGVEYGHWPPLCLPMVSTSMEDVMVGRCLAQVGVEAFPYPAVVGRRWNKRVGTAAGVGTDTDPSSIDDVNSKLSRLFHPVSPSEAVAADAEWYTRMTHSHTAGRGCCADNSISFQNIKGPRYSMECIHAQIYDD
jgi:hypothetical protein